MKYTVLSCAFLSLFPFCMANAVEHHDCSIEFKVNSSVVLQNKQALEACLNQLDQKNVESATVVGSASQSGNLKRNQKLAQERGQTVAQLIKARFPNAIVKQISVGANEEIGKKTQIHFVISDGKDAQVAAQTQQQVDALQQKITQMEAESARKEQLASAENLAAQQKEEKEAHKSFFNENPNFRAALRLGVDSTRVDAKRSYLSGGGEIEWLNRESYMRPEFGVKASTSIDGVKVNNDQVNSVSNVYGFAGIGGTALGLVAGVRLLIGGEWINIDSRTPQQDQAAIGGEARLGYEWKRGTSVFASYGLTDHLQMIGIDVGVSL